MQDVQVLHENCPVQVIQRPEQDNPSIRLIDGTILPSTKSDNVYIILLEVALSHPLCVDKLIEYSNTLADYINEGGSGLKS